MPSPGQWGYKGDKDRALALELLEKKIGKKTNNYNATWMKKAVGENRVQKKKLSPQITTLKFIVYLSLLRDCEGYSFYYYSLDSKYLAVSANSSYSILYITERKTAQLRSYHYFMSHQKEKKCC